MMADIEKSEDFYIKIKAATNYVFYSILTTHSLLKYVLTCDNCLVQMELYKTKRSPEGKEFK